MSDAATTPEPTETPSEPSELSPPSGEPTPEEIPNPPPARGLYEAGLRFQDTDPVPDWAKGKTGKELVEMMQGVLARIPQQPAAEPTNPYEPNAGRQQPPMNGNGQQPHAPSPPPASLQYDDPEAYQRQLLDYIQQVNSSTLQQAAQPLLTGQVETAKHLSRTNPEYAEIWKRWEPEIMALCAQLPLAYQANPATWNQAAQNVRGNHYRELAREEAERLAAGLPASGGAPETEPAGGSGSLPTPASSGARPLDKLFEDGHAYVRRFQQAGLSAKDVRAMLPKMGYSGPDAEQRYVDAIKSAGIVVSGSGSQTEARAYQPA